MISKYSDLPLWADPSARFVPWIIALMVYLATISLLVALTISSVVDRWDRGLANKITIEIPAAMGAVSPTEEASLHQQKAVDILRKTQGIKTFRILSQEEIVEIMKPWFGENTALEGMLLPSLIEVEIQNREDLDLKSLTENLQTMVPGVSVEDHQVWQQGIFNLARTAKAIGFLVVTFITFAAISTIAFTSQTSLIIHRQIIEILHLIGAKNEYIAKQFQYHALKLGLRGGIVGLLLTILTMVMLQFFTKDIDTSFLTGSISNWDIWSIGILVPAVVTAFMMFSARLTVLIMLKKI